MAKKKVSTQEIRVPEIQKRVIRFTIQGTSPVIVHAWSEKAKTMIRDKQQKGKKTANRELRDPEEEARACMYVTKDGDVGVAAMAVKSSIIGAAHKDIGIERTLVRKSLFLECEDPNGVLPFTKCDGPHIREDMVRVGMGSADLRYRPEFREWEVDVAFQYDAGNLQVDDIIRLVDRAGFGIGIGDWRPEKDGEFGRFKVVMDSVVDEAA